MQSRITKTNEENISKSNFTERLQKQLYLQQIVSSRITFSKELIISRNSKYGDLVWNWNNNSNPRLKVYHKSELLIDWEHFKKIYDLTPEIIDDLKRYVFFRLNYSTVIFLSSKKNAHPFAIINEVRCVSRFLRHLRLTVSVAGKSLITKFSDIEIQDLRNAFETYSLPKDSCLRMVLTNLASEMLNKHLDHGLLKWNKEDIAFLPWKKQRSIPHPQLPKNLFSFLSNSASSDVKQFLTALQINVQDETSMGIGSNVFLQNFTHFRDLFEGYVKYRNDLIKKDKGGASQFVNWTRREDVSIGHTIELIMRACYAARIIIMLYTGARYSELVGFKLDCLRKENCFWYICGTVIKHRELDAPVEQDKWIAIPIVRDAVNVLKQTAQLSNSDLLFHPCVFPPSDSNKFIDSTTITSSIKRYISIIDVRNEWKKVNVYPQMFRNSLVFEMRKASLGLPFITYQLKHAYNALERSVSETTLGYGSLGSDAVQKAIADANYVALRDLYHPDASIAGGGAEQHKNRREAYFRGMIHQGIEIDEILRFLANEGGMPLTDVGLGYCQGQVAKIALDGKKTNPPCIGSLRCSPLNCQNAVIPEHKLPAWEKSLAENQSRADDPEFAYARERLLEAVAEAQSVVQFFQIKGRERNV